jgi:transcriptional regulator with GAF, ATPase, and Fis domain
MDHAGRLSAAYAAAPTEGQVRFVALIRRVMQQMVISPRINDALDAITSGLIEELDAVTARLWLFGGDQDCGVCRRGPTPARSTRARDSALHLCSAAGREERIDGDEHTSRRGQFLFAVVTSSREPVRVDDVQRDQRIDSQLRGALARVGAKAVVAYPLVFRDEIQGVLCLSFREPIGDDAFEQLQLVAFQATMAIKGSKLLADSEKSGRKLRAENVYLQNEIDGDDGSEGIISRSTLLREVLHLAAVVAPTDTTVLLLGETGTGKELIARAIHRRSARAARAFITMNCGAITPTLAESEMFGHERGAFTGAVGRRLGRFELANKSSLFMDEIGELPLDAQAAVLRAIEEREFVRVGGERPIQTDVRLIAATNRDLGEAVARGRFREDLFYRINVFPLHLPPLRERPEDIPLLVKHFLKHFQRILAKPFTNVTRDSMTALKAYPWPGNIRELRNVIERACVLATGPLVSVPMDDRSRAPRSSVLGTMESVEREHLRHVLASTRGRISGPRGAASILGLNPNTLRSRLTKLGLTAKTG